MACSICRKDGHTKPRCPVIKNQKEEREKFITETAILALPDLLSNPLVVAFVWYTFSTYNPAANSANKVIVGAELIPALDLGLPPGVMLGAIMQETDDFIAYWNKAKDMFNLDILPDLPPVPKFVGPETAINPIEAIWKEVFLPIWLITTGGGRVPGV